MNRIADITDLVLDDSNSDDEDSIIDNGFNSSMEIAQDVENGRVFRKGRKRRGGGHDDGLIVSSSTHQCCRPLFEATAAIVFSTKKPVRRPAG